MNPMYGQNKADAEIAASSDVSSYFQEYTVTANIAQNSGKVRCIELNHASVVIAISGMAGADYAGQVVIVKDTSASGTAAHTVTLASGTWNGTNTIVTLNAPAECIAVYFDSNGAGTILENVGSVALS